MEMEFDSERMFKLLKELDPKRQKRAIRQGVEEAGKLVRDEAETNLKNSGLKWNKEVLKGLRLVIYRKVLGFKVTVGTRRKRKNEVAGKYRKILLWAEGGTMPRKIQGRGWFRFFKKTPGRGSMPAYRFMEKTQPELKDVEDSIRRNIFKRIEYTAKKYGGKLT